MKQSKSPKKPPPAPAPPAAPPVPRGLNFLLAATTLTSAWLLFQVQPMVAKRILPWFGGGTAIWTTAMLFFQTALFAGYLYAHLLVRALAPARQAAVHITLLVLAAGLATIVGVIPADSWQPAPGNRPVVDILVLLAACVGLPYLLLASTAPLTQVWFARANPGRTPYRLYALSNFGSLAALISYPLAIEPRLGVISQGAAWSYLYLGFAILCAASAFLALRAATLPPGEVAAATGSAAPAPTQNSPPPARSAAFEWFLWLALPAAASVALIAITAFICQDIASIPLLWIAPMIVYLLSFILTFESDRWYRRSFWGPALAVTTLFGVYMWDNTTNWSLAVQLISQLGLLLSIAMICHGELARMRPPAARLTAFYLAISGGGALGGLLAGVVAPLVFSDYYELPIIIPAVWVLAFVILVTDRTSPVFDGKNFRWLLGMFAIFLAVIAIVVNHVSNRRANTIEQERSFYGVLLVREYRNDALHIGYRRLANGRISHGAQFLAPEGRRGPSQYYGPASGIGQILAPYIEKVLPGAPASASSPEAAPPGPLFPAAHPKSPRRVGAVGLGVGTLAAYAEPGDDYRFYDINPQVIDIADRYFTFLSDARDRGATIHTILGDARLELEREPPQNFDVIALDAFTSDSIPSHLLTREAFAVYLRHLAKPDGVLAVHISNRYLNLAIVVNAAADYYKLDSRLVYSRSDDTPIGSDAVWLLVFRPEAYLAKIPFGATPAKTGPGVMPNILWTDDYNNMLDLLYNGNAR